MANNRQKLELTWIGKDIQPKLEPRILLEDTGKSYGDKNSGNRLIHGDNLLALKALEQEFIGKVKCSYIDPPFNTQQAFEHYDDGYEHSIWLSLIRDRVKYIHRLLSDDGTFFVHIDDNELGYLIVLLDEIFGRSNRISVITFKQGAATGHKSINPGVVSTSNFLLVYAKNKSFWKPNRVYTARSQRDKRYNQFIENYQDDYDKWSFITLNQALAIKLNIPAKEIKKNLHDEYEDILDNFVIENANCVVQFARPDYKAVSNEARAIIEKSKLYNHKVFSLKRQIYSDMYFIRGQRILFYSDKLKLVDGQYVAGESLTSIWDDVLSNNLHKEGEVVFPKGKKPEALIKRCLELSTNPNDLVLDSFAGSGTTGAVAHKMGRRWIMVELGEHCHTHILPRMQKVCDGTDQGGISKAVNWQGGGGFKYYDLAPSLLKKDRYDQWIINTDYNPTMLAAAMAKHEGFRYRPDENLYWKQGRSSEQDFIFTTTLHITPEHLDSIHDEMQPDEHVLICCKSYFEGAEDRHTRVNIKKIPSMLLGRCEFDRDDYSLHIVDMPRDPDEPDFVPPGPPVIEPKAKPNKADLAGQMNLFTGSES
ncbi:MAG: site-specific DNA-methyltransferase [Proteobacteria bacterium]|nr:site-specific DNA-methyltransferase [Pseudomonadota bacterium]